MRKTIALAMVMAVAVTARAEWTNWVTFHQPDYVMVTSGHDATATVSSVGLTADRAYACFVVTNMPFLTEALASSSATNTSSYTQLIFSMVKRFFNDLDVTTTPTYMTGSESVRASTAGDIRFSHSFEVDFSLTGGGVVGE